MAFSKFFRSWGFVGVMAGWVAAPEEAQAAIAGAWETFATEEHADAWSVLDEADGELYQVDWVDPEDGDPYISAVHDGDYSLTFLAASEVGDGALEGDYLAANVAAISCDIFIDDLDEFEAVECSVVAEGSAGTRVYYSYAYLADDFSDEGWWTVDFSFDEEWFYDDDGEWVAIAVDESFLESVTDIGIGFYPQIGTKINTLAAIDNVILEPRIFAPELEWAVEGSNFRISFTPAPGLLAAVERMGPAPALTWNEVIADVTGPATYQFSTPIEARAGIFRVKVEPGYLVLPSPL